MQDIEQTAITVRDAIRNIPKQYGHNQDKIKNLEDERQDILHLIELTNFNAYEGYKLSNELQRIQQERRKLKKENELLKPLIQPLSKMKGNLKHLDDAVGQIRKVKQNQQIKSYRCRVRKDLQDIINGVKEEIE